MLAYMETSASLSSGRYVARLTALPFFRVRAWGEPAWLGIPGGASILMTAGVFFGDTYRTLPAVGCGLNFSFVAFDIANFNARWDMLTDTFIPFSFHLLWFI